jgi:hypothetical protein
MMEVISFDTGRVTWLFPTEEFVPLGGADGMLIISKIAERYEFRNFPSNPTREEIDKSGLKFSGGYFKFEDKKTPISQFDLYNDGIVAVSTTTEQASAFLDDIVEFAIAKFDFRRPISPIKKINVSVVTVEFDSAVTSLLASQNALKNLVAGYLNAPLGTSYPAAVTRLDFLLDDGSASLNARPKLILESRATVPLARRRYVSNAALCTKDHLELLGKIEQTFMSPSTTDA